MQSETRSKSIATALYINAAILGGILVVLLGKSTNSAMIPSLIPAAMAQPAPQPIAGGGGLFLMPAQFSTNTFGCYVMDVDAQTLCAYQFLPGNKNLQLVAARNFRYDRRLGAFNTTPDPAEVKSWLEKEQNNQRTSVSPPEPTSPEKKE